MTIFFLSFSHSLSLSLLLTQLSYYSHFSRFFPSLSSVFLFYSTHSLVLALQHLTTARAVCPGSIWDATFSFHLLRRILPRRSDTHHATVTHLLPFTWFQMLKTSIQKDIYTTTILIVRNVYPLMDCLAKDWFFSLTHGWHSFLRIFTPKNRLNFTHVSTLEN